MVISSKAVIMEPVCMCIIAHLICMAVQSEAMLQVGVVASLRSVAHLTCMVV